MAAKPRFYRSCYFWLMFLLTVVLLMGLMLLVAGLVTGSPPGPVRIML